jgi:antitoxin HicB
MVRYPVTLTRDDNDTLLVSFPDFPEAHTFGEDKDEALTRAVDALQTIIDAYIRDRQNIPEPSAIKGEHVTLPALVATKLQLYRRMREEHINKTELARRLQVHLPQVDRLLDVRHGSKLEQLEAAAEALGGHLDVVFVLPEKKTRTLPPEDRARIRRQMRRRMTPVHAGVLTAQKGISARRLGGKKR